MAANKPDLKKRRKLVFDIHMSAGSPRVVPCTVTSSAYPTPNLTTSRGDRHATLLQDYPALTKGDSFQARQQRQVRAWFVPSKISTGANHPLVRTTLEFVNLTNAGGAASKVQIPPTDQLVNEGGFTRTILAGQDATFTRQFGVRIAHNLTGTPAAGAFVKGQLYVHRLHSIEV